jgi:predicted DNA-binding transcriptional regulator YafY
MDEAEAVTIDYTNWRGVRAKREIEPMFWTFTSNEWHRERQWLLTATDLEKREVRMFALSGVHNPSVLPTLPESALTPSET